MSNQEPQVSERMIYGVYFCLAALCLSIGLGFLLGAGAGWIFFGLFCVMVVAASEKLKKAGAKPTNSIDNKDVSE